MLIIGDVHARLNRYFDIINGEEDTFQVGDMGLGFPGFDYKPIIEDFKTLEGDHKFIRGNHDNPEYCKTQYPKNYAGEYGIYKGKFFIGGAYSIDKNLRTPGIDWWMEEQLSEGKLDKAIEAYKQTKPEIVLSHECPKKIKLEILRNEVNGRISLDRTSMALDKMFMIHKPKMWIFGHYHKSWKYKQDGCDFICLNELEKIRI